MRRTFLLLGLAGLAGCGEAKLPLPAAPPKIVEVAQPVRRQVVDYQIFTARTQAVKSVDIKARVSGYLTEIHFTDGGEVTETQVLFKIDDRPYAAALEKAKGQVEYQQAALIQAQADLDIALDTQKQNPGAVSKQELKQREGARDEAAGALKAAQAEQVSAQLNLNWCSVTAPIAGRADRHFVDIGNLVTQDQTLLTNIVSLKPVWAYFNVDENTALRVSRLVAEGTLKPAESGDVIARMGLELDEDFPFAGHIDFVSNQLDPNTGSIQVRAVFPNEEGALSAGLFGRVQVPISAPHEGLLVDDRAIGTDQSQYYLLVVDDKNVVAYRQVETGQLYDGLREVFAFRTITTTRPDGTQTSEQVRVLSPTDWVIVNGLQRVKTGDTAEARKVAMTTLLPIEQSDRSAAPAKPAGETRGKDISTPTGPTPKSATPAAEKSKE